MSAVVLEDFVKPFVDKPLSDRAINWIMRSVVVGVGVVCLCLVYVVEKLGTVLQLTMSLEAITNGPLFGIFTVGIFLPWVKGNVSVFEDYLSTSFSKKNMIVVSSYRRNCRCYCYVMDKLESSICHCFWRNAV